MLLGLLLNMIMIVLWQISGKIDNGSFAIAMAILVNAAILYGKGKYI